MAVENTVYTPAPTVERFMLSRKKIKVINGPVGSGKSVGCLMAIARECQLQAPSKDGYRYSRWAVIRNTNQQLLDTTFKSWIQWFPSGAAGQWRISDKTFHLRMGDVRAEIMFRPLDSPEDLQRLLSLELTSAYFNELREIDTTIVDGVRTRIGRYPAKKDGGATNAHIIADTNPPDEDSWTYDLMEKPGPRDRELIEIFKQPGGMDPGAENLENLPENYYEDMSIGASEDFVNVHVHAQYGKSNLGKPVHRRFNERRHVSDHIIEPLAKVMTVIGMDFGTTPAAVFKQMDGWGRVNTLDICWTEDDYFEHFLDTQVTPLIKQRYAGNPIFVVGDPSGVARGNKAKSSCFDILADRGYIAEPASTNDPNTRIQATEHYMLRLAGDAEPAYMVSPHCNHLIRALRGGYRYAKKRTRDGDFATTPDKNIYSHVAEANQYGDMFFVHGMDAKAARKLERQKRAQATVKPYTPLDREIGY